MKLRRAVVTAAAAAVVPVAVLSAPGAFADSGTPGPTTTTAPATGPAAPSESPRTDRSATPSQDASPSASTTSTAPPVAPRKTVVPTQEPGDATECTSREDDPMVLAELRGLPTKIVAGSGWHAFTFRVSNLTAKDFESTSAQVFGSSFAATEDNDEDAPDTSRHLHLQWSDGDRWHDIDIDRAHDRSFPTSGELAVREHADVPLRIKIDAAAPAGAGAVVPIAASVNADGTCSDSVPEDGYVDFDILAAAPASSAPATSSPSSPAATTPSPSVGSSASPQSGGSLAATGAGSLVPTAGVAGALAVVAGAGVVYSVRRRRADAGS